MWPFVARVACVTMWESWVDSNGASSSDSAEQPRHWILTFSRHEKDLEEAILQSVPDLGIER